MRNFTDRYGIQFWRYTSEPEPRPPEAADYNS
jgi:hypothetical protein